MPFSSLVLEKVDSNANDAKVCVWLKTVFGRVLSPVNFMLSMRVGLSCIPLAVVAFSCLCRTAYQRARANTSSPAPATLPWLVEAQTEAEVRAQLLLPDQRRELRQPLVSEHRRYRCFNVGTCEHRRFQR